MRARLVVAVMFLAASFSAAATGIKGEEEVFFAGHYGEVLKLRGGWEIRASMQGEAEVINHYPLDPGQQDRKPSDFVPENFTRDNLIQLVIMPWSVSASKSLDQLKRLKIEDLKSSGVDFRIIDDPFPGYGNMGRKWPAGTFEVLIAKPYVLSQLYTTSGRHLAILTTGWDSPPSSVISSHYDPMRMSLRDWVVPETGREEPKTYGPVPAPLPSEGISFRVLAKPPVWMTWLLLTGASCLLLGLLGAAKQWEPIRRASLSLLIFSNAGALVGALVGLCFWPFAWAAPHLTAASALACLFIPALAWAVGRARGRRPRRRALIGAAAWSLVAAALLTYVSVVATLGREWAPHIPSFTAIIAFACYAVGGVLFALLDSNEDLPGRKLMAAAVLLVLSPSAQAQPGPVRIGKGTPNAIENVARKNVKKHGLTRESFRRKATDELRKTEVLYDYQRVEIKGIFASDVTDSTIPDLFDLEVSASHVADNGNSTVVPSWARSAFNHARDLYDLKDDAHGQFTEAAKNAVKALSGSEVNEIVAHSWGTEIVYNAILNGDVKPPRRLIVCGMPDRDLQKWVALSKYTGTEVIVLPNTKDPIAEAARLGGSVIDALAKAEGGKGNREVPTPAAAQFEADWAAACRTRPCNTRARVPTPVTFNYNYLGRSHNRHLYYESMLKDGTIPRGTSDAKLLGARQDAKIMAEADRLLEKTVGKEAANLSPESVKVKAADDFLSEWQSGADAITTRSAQLLAELDADKRRRRAEEDARAEAEKIRLEKERVEREEIAEAVRLAREQADRDTWAGIEASAAACGYSPVITQNGGKFIGFSSPQELHFLRPPFTEGLTVTDYRIAFLINRACYGAGRNSEKNPPRACNDSTRFIPAFAAGNDVPAKLESMFQRVVDRRCIDYILDPQNRINDKVSFDRSMAKYHKLLLEEKADYEKRFPFNPPREKKDPPREERPPRDDDRKRTDPDHDEVRRRTGIW